MAIKHTECEQYLIENIFICRRPDYFNSLKRLSPGIMAKIIGI
jgi:hypothetical protein